MAPKTWGPFTGRQLTVILCTLIVMLLLPVGAWAISGNNVFVTDASTGRHGAIDVKSGLIVAVHDAASGKAATVNSAGQLQVSGNVTDGVAAPNSFVQSLPALGIATYPSATAVEAPPGGKALIVTRVHLSWSGASGVAEPIFYVGDSSCTILNAGIVGGNLDGAQGSRDIDLSPGWPVSSTSRVCGTVFQGTATVDASISGYSVAASAVATPGPLGLSLRQAARRHS